MMTAPRLCRRLSPTLDQLVDRAGTNCRKDMVSNHLILHEFTLTITMSNNTYKDSPNNAV